MRAKIASKPILFSFAGAFLIWAAYMVFIAIFSADYGYENIFGWLVQSHADLEIYIVMRSVARFVFSIPAIILLGAVLRVNGFKYTFGVKGFKAALPVMAPAFLLMAVSALRVVNIAEINIYQVRFIPYAVSFHLSTGVFEEVLCRGLLMAAALHLWGNTKKGKWTVVLVSSLLFGLAHFSAGVNGVFHATLAGIYFAALYVHSKNLLSCIIVHTLWNIALGMVQGMSWGVYHSEAWAQFFALAPDVIRVVGLTAVAIVVINKSKPFSDLCEQGRVE